MLEFLLRHTPLLYLTQSVWRDEAFSILLSERSIGSFTNIIFEPPLYYILLHFWMKIFGNSEIAVRSLSLIGFSLATIVVILWAEKLFRKHWLSWYLPVFFFFNPMLLYYAFEVRAYSWYIFFTIASMYTYLGGRFRWYIVATTLGLYTHTYMIIVPAVQALHYVLTHRNIFRLKNIKAVIRDPMIQSIVTMGLLFSPWLTKVFFDLSRLKQSWYFPVDIRLVLSVLGNLFIGYEGTPWYLWPFTAILSLLLLIASLYALTSKRTRNRNALFFLLTFIPLGIVIGISFYKPLFVNRYVLPCTIAEIFLVIFAIEHIKNTLLQRGIAMGALIFILGFNIWYPSQHAKFDIRSSVKEVNALITKQDVILVDNPLIFFETIYYSKNRSRVYLYDPSGSPFPWYVGDAIVTPSQIVNDFPPYPIRAFLIHGDATYEIKYSASISK